MKILLIISTLVISLVLNLSAAMSASSDSLLQQGIDANKDSKSTEAIKLLDSALQQNPNLVNAYIERGKAKSQLYKYKEAIKDFDRALQYNPNSVDAYIERGRAKQFLNKYQEAIKDFDRSIEINPKSIPAYVSRGVLYRTCLKQKGRGDLDFDRALSIIPESMDDYSYLRFIYDTREDPRSGIEYFTKAINLNYKNKQYAYLERGDLYGDMNKPKLDLSIIDFKLFLESKSQLTINQRAIVFEWIASNYLKLENYTEAITNANESLRLNPKNYFSLANRGKVFYHYENYSAALADFDRAIITKPKSSWLYAWRGDIYYKLNNDKQAIIEYDRAISLSPSSAYLYQKRGNVKSWFTYPADSALPDYQTALKLAQKDRNLDMLKSLNSSIDDVQTKPQRIAIGLIMALLLTGTGYAGLIVISRHNEAKYLQQFKE